MSERDLVRGKLLGFDAPDTEVEWTPLVGMPVPTLEPAPPVVRAPLPAPPVQPVVPVDVELPPEPEPEPEPEEPFVLPEHWAELRATPAALIAPEGVTQTPVAHAKEVLAGLDRWATGALAVAVLLVWLPLLGGLFALALAGTAMVRGGRSRLVTVALGVAGLEALVGGVLLAISVHDANVRESTREVLTAHLEEAGRVQDIVRTYEGTYAGPRLLAQYGWVTPTDSGFEVTRNNTYGYCMTARQGDIALTLSNGGTVTSRPCQ